MSSIDSAAKIGQPSNPDKREIAVLKLKGSAKLLYQGCTELHAESSTWQSFKDAFRRRYEDVHTDQYHFTKLQTARQKKVESPQEFADRCRGLAQKIMCKTNDPVAQRIHRENAESMLLASFISGLVWNPGTRVRYRNVQSISEELQIAFSVKKQKGKSGSMRDFTEILRNLYVRYLDHLVEHPQEAQASSTQLMCEGLIRRVLSELVPQ